MQKILFRFLFAGLATILVTGLYCWLQYAYQVNKHEQLFIELGFPYPFYYFQLNFEIYGFRLNHFLFDSFYLYLFLFLVLSIFRKKKSKSPVDNGKNLVDEKEC